ncbi:prolipoprotein diacylglyceryl transferase [Thermophagus xiamenensis]|jgi:prolipoprotein diacylglyceryl transferase|uniref:Phosphatidylglycerol--prolipoprotein diacylglyceryl transferase n=1 Tax=Thermophagus xiamenensis TaxID=385682 RepID=A0A1I2C0C3_9BACT|nr:prolipoprotein diacylglyceryl transferase [Thermophagus xiamenensis]SFE61734.1 prolipoprotein diacylglyceryl transferase [Thermophagus xiamenensis]
MFLFNYITWNPDPEIFSLGPLSVRYYGLFFAIAFLLGYYIMERMFKREAAPEQWLDKLFVYVVVATVIGARLGHVFFYGWDYYSQHPGEILAIWHGGLASHGGAIGILIAIYLFSKKVSKRSMLWTLDRLVVPVALAAVFIRSGNLMNSEIVGTVTDLPWGFRFLRASVENPELPRHPSQMYEALAYLVIFAFLMYLYWRTEARLRQGLLFGLFLTGVFTARFFIEFVKENQEAFEEGMALNMGQILSIPFVLAGLYFISRAMKKPPVRK